MISDGINRIDSFFLIPLNNIAIVVYDISNIISAVVILIIIVFEIVRD